VKIYFWKEKSQHFVWLEIFTNLYPRDQSRQEAPELLAEQNFLDLFTPVAHKRILSSLTNSPKPAIKFRNKTEQNESGRILYT
jgi:hypothetical protein